MSWRRGRGGEGGSSAGGIRQKEDLRGDLQQSRHAHRFLCNIREVGGVETPCLCVTTAVDSAAGERAEDSVKNRRKTRGKDILQRRRMEGHISNVYSHENFEEGAQ
jgi:hypothetical protein